MRIEGVEIVRVNYIKYQGSTIQRNGQSVEEERVKGWVERIEI